MRGRTKGRESGKEWCQSHYFFIQIMKTFWESFEQILMGMASLLPIFLIAWNGHFWSYPSFPGMYYFIAKWQMAIFCITVNFIIEELKFCKIAQLFLKDNLRGLWGSLKHKNWNLDTDKGCGNGRPPGASIKSPSKSSTLAKRDLEFRSPFSNSRICQKGCKNNFIKYFTVSVSRLV